MVWDAAATSTFGPVGRAVMTEAVQRNVKLRFAVYDSSDLRLLYQTQAPGLPYMMELVTQSKARSYIDGKELANPTRCQFMCCFMCPWMFGCTKQMAVLGSVPVSVPNNHRYLPSRTAVMVVAGAPAGATDLDIAQTCLRESGFTCNSEGVWSKGSDFKHCRVDSQVAEQDDVCRHQEAHDGVQVVEDRDDEGFSILTTLETTDSDEDVLTVTSLDEDGLVDSIW